MAILAQILVFLLEGVWYALVIAGAGLIFGFGTAAGFAAYLNNEIRKEIKNGHSGKH